MSNERKENESNEDFLIRISSLISVARFRLTECTTLYGLLATNLRIMPAPDHLLSEIDTFCVTPIGICMYNPEYASKQTLKQIQGVLAHEALHPALNYWERFAGLDPELSNEAHDYAINMPIMDCQELDLPEGVLFNEKFRNLSGEEIYKLLEKEAKKQNKESEGEKSPSSGGAGNGAGKSNGEKKFSLKGDINEDLAERIEKEYLNDNNNNPISAEELKKVREEAKMNWKDALKYAFNEEIKQNGKGSLPSWLTKEIQGILTPKLNLSGMLRRFFGGFGFADSPTFKKPNRRNLYCVPAFLKPSFIERKPKLYFLIDTSGSMWNESGYLMVRSALGLIKKLVNNGQYHVVVVMADTEVKREISFEEVQKAVKDKKIESIGGGGSDFTSSFEYIWKDARLTNQAQAPIICFTDGYIDVPAKQAPLRTHTAWITPPNVKPPTKKWGTHMELDAIKINKK